MPSPEVLKCTCCPRFAFSRLKQSCCSIKLHPPRSNPDVRMPGCRRQGAYSRAAASWEPG